MGASNSLRHGLEELIVRKQYISGAVLSYGSQNRVETVVSGNAREVVWCASRMKDAPLLMTEGSLFDLASLTKLFTCLCVLRMIERGLLSPEDKIRNIDPRFVRLADVSIEDLLAFRKGLRTDDRIEELSSRDDALSCLFDIHPVPSPEDRMYTDMGAMVLKYVVESVSSQSFFDHIRDTILIPLGMRHTFSNVSEADIGLMVDYSLERRIIKDRYTVDTGFSQRAGLPHDPKARLLCDGGRDLCGHAGLFSAAGDLVMLARGLLAGKVVSEKTLLDIGVNRTGKRLPGGKFSQHHGYLCYAKNPDQRRSEVPAGFGYRSFALPGFTGNHFCVDPVRKQFIIILANKIHNRVTRVADTQITFSGDGRVLWDDGRAYPLSAEYVFCKDRCLLDPILARMNAWEQDAL